MSKVRIVTDSTADIPAETRERLGIEMVPLKVHFGEEAYRDYLDIKPEEFYGKLKQAKELPTTSQPSPVDFLNVYKRLLEEDPDTEIISVHLSSSLSGTYQSAVLAKSLLEDQTNITIVDSKTASYGIGIIVEEMAKAALEGKSKDECLAIYEPMRQDPRLYFLVDTLEYLQKGGRIGRASALVGSLLHIKPILSLDDSGTIYSVDKVRGQRKALARIVELFEQDLQGKAIALTIVHAEALETAQLAAELIKERFEVKNVRYAMLGPVIGTHVGPGTIGIFAVPAP
ncbi:DegV family protein [Xylanibacillus composti]|uniref:Fatty acid-binding protein DegV n=1 Tax=Xylanibacillus composti TaxID=1572762 RepID=A0A8J4M138_9BACL|nr:DegV family protein [Xylanibacillus composti]MDT9725607.1 DegV family protein [Xylanibacillus composti]GIQ67700.1 fatty acid-binding protein DegV [Xylanibacillus composti]